MMLHSLRFLLAQRALLVFQLEQIVKILESEECSSVMLLTLAYQSTLLCDTLRQVQQQIQVRYKFRALAQGIIAGIFLGIPLFVLTVEASSHHLLSFYLITHANRERLEECRSKGVPQCEVVIPLSARVLYKLTNWIPVRK
ncbi:hypothetical protein ACQ4M3_13455 [Leptolyngbya sp. AN03gr2]